MMIRRMDAQDVSSVAQIEKNTFSLPWSEKSFRDALDNPYAYFLIAEEEGQVVGYVGVYISFEEGEITNVAVDEGFRKNGAGAALMKRLLLDLQEQNVLRIVLEVRASNTPAIRLYEKMGFCKIGTRKGFYDFPKEDADIMQWEASIG